MKNKAQNRVDQKFIQFISIYLGSIEQLNYVRSLYKKWGCHK